MSTLVMAERRLQRILRYAEQSCDSCKDCDDECPQAIVKRLARGEPVHECDLCGERFHDKFDREAHDGGGIPETGLCWICWQDATDKEKTRAKASAATRMERKSVPLPFQALEARVKELEAALQDIVASENKYNRGCCDYGCDAPAVARLALEREDSQ